MRNLLESMLNSIRAFFSKLTQRERIRFGIIAGAIVLLCLILAFFLSRTEYDVLYQGLSSARAGKVLAVLDELQVPYKTRDGGTILVEANQVSSLTMRLANEESLKEDGFDYLMYSGFVNNMTATDKDRRVYLQYTIGSLIRTALIQGGPVEDAWPIVTLPERSSFVGSLTNVQPAKASIELRVAGGRKLTTDEVRAIIDYVKGAVPDISEENIYIIDTNYNHYDLTEKPLLTDISDQLAFKHELQEMLGEQASKILMPIFGFGGFRVQVDAVLNFDTKTTETTVWSPPVEDMTEGLAISASRLLELVRPGFNTGDIPGTDTNGLGTAEYPYGEISDDEEYRKALEEINYELNEIHSLTEAAPGSIEKLTVSVSLDSNMFPDDYSAEVKNLVGGAIGVTPNTVNVARLPFQENSEAEDLLTLQAEVLAKQQQKELMKLIVIIICILLSVALFAFMLISITRIYNRRMEEEAKALSAQMTAEAAAALAAAGVYGYVPGGGIDYLVDDETPTEEFDENSVDENGMPVNPIDAGASKSDFLLELEDFIERDPASAVAMLRNWLSED
ncbi:MAG: flagellar M-ring protein FliF [Oscillospiraceae bacterium]|jgi:flagellar M-ring protein FliF|nr:flagellar M-ring protein FliF [Oscillospiraceae bacterium]